MIKIEKFREFYLDFAHVAGCFSSSNTEWTHQLSPFFFINYKTKHKQDQDSSISILELIWINLSY
jgi:hypothetical protein